MLVNLSNAFTSLSSIRIQFPHIFIRITPNRLEMVVYLNQLRVDLIFAYFMPFTTKVQDDVVIVAKDTGAADNILTFMLF